MLLLQHTIRPHVVILILSDKLVAEIQGTFGIILRRIPIVVIRLILLRRVLVVPLLLTEVGKNGTVPIFLMLTKFIVVSNMTIANRVLSDPSPVLVGIYPLAVSILLYMLIIRQILLGRILVARLQIVYMVQAVGKYPMPISEHIVVNRIHQIIRGKSMQILLLTTKVLVVIHILMVKPVAVIRDIVMTIQQKISIVVTAQP